MAQEGFRSKETHSMEGLESAMAAFVEKSAAAGAEYGALGDDATSLQQEAFERFSNSIKEAGEATYG